MPKISELSDGTALTLTGAEKWPFVQSGTTYEGTTQQLFDRAVALGLFTQTGTGAVSRTQIAKLKETALSITDFGAVAGGSAATNATAIQAAITAGAAQKRAVYIPGAASAYSFDTTLTMTSLVPIFGDGQNRSVLSYTGAGVGLLIQPPIGGAADNHYHFLRDFAIVPSIDGAGTYGIRVQLASGTSFYADFDWHKVLVGIFGTRALYLDNSVANADGIFKGRLDHCLFSNGVLATSIGDALEFNLCSVLGTAAFSITAISGARQIVFDDNTITTSGGFVADSCNGIRFENNHVEIASGVNYSGTTNAGVSFNNCTEVTVRKNRIAKVGTGTKPNDALLLDGTTTGAQCWENELAIGNNTHIRTGASTGSIGIGSNTYDSTETITKGNASNYRWLPDGFTTVGNTNYIFLKTDRVVSTNAAFTAPRTWTLPLAASVNKGQRLLVLDSAGGLTSTNTLTLARAGADTINGATSVVLNGQAFGIELISDGAVAWVYYLPTAAQLGSNYALMRSPGNWKVFYSDGSGALTALATGADLTFLRGNGVAAAPTWTGYGTYATHLPGPWTTSYSDVNGVAQPLALGAAGTVLTSSGASSVPSWVTPSAAGTISNPGGRLTLASATPVMTSTQSAKTTIFYTPYKGQWVPLYNGTQFVMTDIGGELSQATTDNTKSPAAVAASSVYDIFVWNDGGTFRATRGAVWTNDTTRAAGLTLQNGIYLNTSSVTNGPAALRGTYVGTVRSNASSQIDWIFGALAAGATAGFLGVWNAYNRVDVASSSGDTVDSWTCSSTSVRAANANNNLRTTYVVGLSEDSVVALYGVACSSGVANALTSVGIDSTTTISFGASAFIPANSSLSAAAFYYGLPGLGVHFIQALESVQSASTATFYGDAGLPAQVQSALSVELRM